MRPRLWLTAAGVAVAVSVALLLSRPQEAVVPQHPFSPRTKETRPLFTSCAHARQAGVPLPLQVGDPGWNPRLDRDKNGLAC